MATMLPASAARDHGLMVRISFVVSHQDTDTTGSDPAIDFPDTMLIRVDFSGNIVSENISKNLSEKNYEHHKPNNGANV